MINKIMFGVVLLFAEINVVVIIIYLAFFALKCHKFPCKQYWRAFFTKNKVESKNFKRLL